MMFRPLQFTLPFAAIALSTMLGCFSSSKQDWAELLKKKDPSKSSSAAPGKPLFGVVGQSLGDGQEVSLPTEQLLGRVLDLQTNRRSGRAVRFVMRHPDAALELLRSKPKVNDAAVELIAAAHDRQCNLPDTAQTWSRLLAARKDAPEAFDEYEKVRNQFKAAMAEGHAKHALGLGLINRAEAAKSPLLSIDAAYLHGVAHLLDESANEAAAAFFQAVAHAERVSRYQYTYSLLMAGDAQRRAGDPQSAANTWQAAVDSATRLLLTEQPIHDPVLWERLGYLRPVERPWPEQTVSALQTLDPLPGLELPAAAMGAVASDRAADPRTAEAVVWNAIGTWYLDRDQAQAALVSYKRAESGAMAPEAQKWLRFRQARALVQLNQSGPATAILLSLGSDKLSSAGPAALGLLGSLRLKNGQLQQGLGLLRNSIERNELQQWPGKAQAEADLALAYLMFGDEQNGLQRLHQAQGHFEMLKDWESLTLALENEAAYMENIEKRKDSSAIRSRIRELESR